MFEWMNLVLLSAWFRLQIAIPPHGDAGMAATPPAKSRRPASAFPFFALMQTMSCGYWLFG